MRKFLYKSILFVTAGLLSCCTTKMQAEDVVIRFYPDRAEVKVANRDSVEAKVEGAHVTLKSDYRQHTLTIKMSGNSNDGQLKLKAKGDAYIKLNNLSLNSMEGAPFHFSNKHEVSIEAKKGTSNQLTITACRDTAKHKSAVIWAKGDLNLKGKGELYLRAIGDGCRGINVKGDITIDDLTLSVITEGNNLGKKQGGLFGMPPMGDGEMPHFPEGMPFPEGMQFPEGMGFPGGMDFPGGFEFPADFKFPDMPEGMEFPGGFGPPPPFGQGGPGEGMDMPFGGGPGLSGDPDETIKNEFKQRYIKSTKGIRSEGTITINSGNVYCKTSSAGAEGMEGKRGITIQGGFVQVDAIDDAMNANGPIRFLGGKTIAESHCNDAVDSNLNGFFGTGAQGGGPDPGGFGGFGPGPGPGGFGGGFPGSDKETEPSIIISGGEVYAWNHIGAPEEGLDCDFAPIEVSGGKLFTMGGGMGEMPSVPTQKTAKQPTILFTGLSVVKGETIEILDGKKVIYSQEIPFSFNNSASLLSCKNLKVGEKYTLRTSTINQEFTLSESYIKVRIVK